MHESMDQGTPFADSSGVSLAHWKREPGVLSPLAIVVLDEMKGSQQIESHTSTVIRAPLSQHHSLLRPALFHFFTPMRVGQNMYRSPIPGV